MNRNKLKKRKLFAGIFFSVVLLASLFSLSPSLAEEGEPSWGYGGAYNSTHWSELSTEFESCDAGRDQSPININFGEERSGEIKFNYQASTAKVVDNGHTIEVDFEPGNSVNINGQKYELLQFHFHTPSEHRLENEASAMELHFVHQNEAKELAVVGVMMDAGDENSVIADVWDAIPTRNKADKASTTSINPLELLPKDKTFVSYAGSLTTPPCSEQVSWNLLLESIELSAKQIGTFESFYPYNARLIQPRNGRSIELHSQ